MRKIGLDASPNSADGSCAFPWDENFTKHGRFCLPSLGKDELPAFGSSQAAVLDLRKIRGSISLLVEWIFQTERRPISD
jgi:hypothetical protein